MSSSFRRHRDLTLSPPVLPHGVQESEHVRRIREVPALVIELTEALDARAVAEQEASLFRALNEGHAGPLVSADDSAEIGELVSLIEDSPALFAVRFLELEQRVADLTARHNGLSARVGP